MIQRGDVWWADLPDPTGSSPGYRRPVIVVQSDSFNRSRIGTILIVPLTSNLDREKVPGHIRLARRETSLPRESVALTSQVLTVDRADFALRVGAIPPTAMRAIDRGLRSALEL
ncbi:MAG: type II toxin-antitoxin system PemK/MazF family toxin [Candidatus Eisenbacteria bacterium]|nr:type II toxin-antitoxin system PemK/MazF family toxin [Candidatus Eisenbacteria bacterium]